MKNYQTFVGTYVQYEIKYSIWKISKFFLVATNFRQLTGIATCEAIVIEITTLRRQRICEWNDGIIYCLHFSYFNRTAFPKKILIGIKEMQKNFNGYFRGL